MASLKVSIVITSAAALCLLGHTITHAAEASPAWGGDSESAKAVVKAYWQSPYEKRYELFSRRYREILKRLGAANAQEYAKAQDPERVWRQQIYEKAVMRSGDSAQVTVLASWEHVGYQGVMTFIFDLVREDGTWKIANIAY